MKNGKSAFMGVSAAFAHFIVIQMVALLCAIWARVTDFPLPDGHWLILYMYWLAPIGHFIGFLLFIYALMTALAATMGIFRVASWYERHKKISLTNRSRVRIKLKGFKSAIKR